MTKPKFGWRRVTTCRALRPAETLEGLIERLKIVIPELLVENGLLSANIESVPFEVRAKRSELAPVG